MNESKPFYQSTTIWFAVGGIVVSILSKLDIIDFQTFIDLMSLAGFGTALGIRKKMGGLSAKKAEE